MKQVIATPRTIRQLLTGVKYTIDFYQREYEWERRNIEELLDDLENMFTLSHSPDNERTKVQDYPRYFLGTIITSKEDNRNYIVDGQQRLTTLTLLLIYIHHLRLAGNAKVHDVSSLIFSESYGEPSFNINIPARMDCLKGLYDNGEYHDANVKDLSIRYLVRRYSDIQELFPDALAGDSLPYFVDWLIDNVDLVEIEAYTDDDAFTIFETMNDRGVNLGQVDMLKGFLLANIKDAREKRKEAGDRWISNIANLREIDSRLDSKADHDFFLVWLRAKYAETTRDRSNSTGKHDFGEISRFHRWLRDTRDRIGLRTTQDYYEFITQHFDTYAGLYIMMREASTTLGAELKEVYFNAQLIDTQYMLALAPIKLQDSNNTSLEKIRLVTTFLDIYLARRMVNFKRIGNSTLQENLFNPMKAIRDMDVPEVRAYLRDYLNQMDETFRGITEGNSGPFRLKQNNRRHISFLLARMTAWIEGQSQVNTSFLTYTDGQGSPFEIEHIWASNYEVHQKEFVSETEFQDYRNYFGGLILLPRGRNQSFGASVYEEKLNHYVEENLLAASLHSQKYEKNPDFRRFRENSRLPFKPHTQFKRADLMERQALYRQICEQIWNPDRLLAQG